MVSVGEIVWAGALVVLLGFELWAVRYKPRATLTAVIRRAFNIKGAVIGAVIFGVAWTVAAVLFGTHIIIGWP